MADNPPLQAGPQLIGQTLLGRFEILQLLKATSVLSVCLGRDLARNGARVIVKCIAGRRGASSALSRLEHEAQILASIHKPEVAPILHLGQDRDSLLLVTPYVSGVSLSERLQGHGPLNLDELTRLGLSMASALREVHALGILHRDIKPSNIIVNPHGPLARATLIDFGQAHDTLGKTPHHEPLAFTALYAAPEQTGLLNRPVDERSDLYALGIVLYEAACGHPPFHGADLNEVLTHHLSSAPPSLAAQVKGLPLPLEDLILRLMAKDPDDRYQSAAALAHDLTEITHARAQGHCLEGVTLGKADTRRQLTVPSFVGRQGELTKLRSYLHDASLGQGQQVIVKAPSGAGKSRLLAELQREARNAGLLVLQGQGICEGASYPFQLLSGIALDLLAAAAGDAKLGQRLRQQLWEHTPTLCALLPSLRPLLQASDDGRLAPEVADPDRSAAALAALFANVGHSSRASLIVFDDAQWADRASTDLLLACHQLYANSSKDQHFYTVVFAFRSEGETAADAPPSSELEVGLSALPVMSLDPLSDHDIARMLTTMAGPLPADLLPRLIEVSGANPFMAEGLLRGMVESGALQASSQGWQVDSVTLASLQSSRRAALVLSSRLESLPPSVLAFLCETALLGKSFFRKLAVLLASCDAKAAHAALEMARRRHLLLEGPQTEQCTFVHDKVREALLAHLSTEQRRAYHQRAAQLLASLSEATDFELAYHYDAAGDPSRAYPHALRAADQARRQYALAMAEQYYRIAERGLPEGDPQAAAALAKALGDVLLIHGNFPEAGRQLAKAKALANDRLQQASIQLALGELACKGGEVEEAIRALIQGLALFGSRVPRHRLVFLLCLIGEVMVQAAHSLRLYLWPSYRSKQPMDEQARLTLHMYSRLYFSYWFKGTIPAMWAHMRGLNLAERYEESAELAHAYCDHSVIASTVPLLRRGSTYAARALAIRRRQQDAWGEAQALGYYGASLYVASRYSEGMGFSSEALALLKRTGDRWTYKLALWSYLHFHYRLGNLPTCAQLCREVYQTSTSMGDYTTSSMILSLWALSSRGQVPEECLRKEEEREIADEQTAATVKLARGIQCLYAKDFPAALSALRANVALIEQGKIRHEYVVHNTLWLVSGLRMAADACHHLDPQRPLLMQEAATLWRRSIRQARLFRNNLPHALREGAFIAAWQGRTKRARKRLEQSLALAQAQQARYEHAQSLAARGQLGQFYAWPDASQDAQRAALALQEWADTAEVMSSNPLSLDQRPELSLLARFETVLEDGHKVITALDEGAIYAALLATATKLFRSERCLIVAPPVNGDNKLYVLAGQKEQAISRKLIQHALSCGGAVTFDEDHTHDLSDSLILTNARSALCVPIKQHQDAVACLYVSHPSVGQLFQNNELKLGRFLAVLAGAALENAEGFGRLQSFNESLRQLAAERQEVAAELQAAKEIAEATSRAKSQFLSNMSHEMRTPLVAILNFSRFLASPDLTPEEARYFVDTIERNGSLLNRLIEDTLDLTRAEAGRLVVEKTSFALGSFLDKLAADFAQQAHAKHISFDLQRAADLPPTITSDPKRLQQLLTHVVGNAIKFTEQGKVVVGVHLVQNPGTQASLAFVIEDTGCGLSPKAQSQLFQIFTQADASDTRRHSGSGIGLYLASKLAKALGGQLELTHSLPEQGCVFTIHIALN